MSRALEDHGWSIFGVAGSIEEANSLLAEPERPDAAVLDVKLAGKDVFPLAQSLRIAGIPFLFCTGYKDLCHIQDFARHRAVRKPATVHQIVQGLKDVVHSAKAELIPARAADQRQVRA
jgi:DNA-binding response OmpR family regulator